METKFQKIKQLTDLVYSLMSASNSVDMSSIEIVIGWGMESLKLVFIPFKELMDSMGDYLYEVTSFDTTSEYFFDKINTSNISKNQIDVLVNRCVA